MQRIIKRVWPLFVALLLGACATSAPIEAPTAAVGGTPTAAPTRVPTAPTTVATAVPTAVPTAPPSVTAAPTAPSTDVSAPPAALYALSAGQIVRIEPDGAQTAVTSEDEPIQEFDVAADSRTLAYLLGEDDTRTLVLSDPDGANRIDLLEMPIIQPRISPDGSRVAVALLQPVDGLQIGREGSDTGVLLAASTGGRPGFLQVDDPGAIGDDPAPDARRFVPVAWSPDSSRMLMAITYPVGEGATFAVRQVDDVEGSLTLIERCCYAAWSTDGASIMGDGGQGLQDNPLGLWQADPATGTVSEVLPAYDGDTPLIAADSRQLTDGQIYTMLPSDEVVVDSPTLAYSPFRIGADGARTRLSQGSYAYREALWAEDGSGVLLVALSATTEDTQLIWVPSDGGSAVELGRNLSNLRWVP